MALTWLLAVLMVAPSQQMEVLELDESGKLGLGGLETSLQTLESDSDQDLEIMESPASTTSLEKLNMEHMEHAPPFCNGLVRWYHPGCPAEGKLTKAVLGGGEKYQPDPRNPASCDDTHLNAAPSCACECPFTLQEEGAKACGLTCEDNREKKSDLPHQAPELVFCTKDSATGNVLVCSSAEWYCVCNCLLGDLQMKTDNTVHMM